MAVVESAVSKALRGPDPDFRFVASVVEEPKNKQGLTLRDKHQITRLLAVEKSVDLLANESLVDHNNKVLLLYTLVNHDWRTATVVLKAQTDKRASLILPQIQPTTTIVRSTNGYRASTRGAYGRH